MAFRSLARFGCAVTHDGLYFLPECFRPALGIITVANGFGEVALPADVGVLQTFGPAANLP